jgi:uroporphyrin-III C-methyltransferase/precorrin-2 dehydrogenase/sirohydrochlorin ferrochelatase
VTPPNRPTADGPDRRPLAPLLIDLTGRLVVVAGGGPVAERRVRTMLGGGARVRVVARQACSGIIDLAEAGRIELREGDFSAADADGAFLLIAATDDAEANATAREVAAASGCLLNNAAEPDLGDVVVPAELRQGRLRMTVSTSGASPSVARRIRDRIAAEFGPRWQRYLDTLADARVLARSQTADPLARLALLEALGSPQLETRFFAEHLDAAQLLEAATELAAANAAAVAAALTEPDQTTLVSLVGAGPGDPGLITTRGLERLRAADIVVYDYLIDERLIAEVRAGAELVYVGKRGGHHHRTQDEINALLIEYGLSGDARLIVRLKGGDPFIFGRGGEEALALAEAGVQFEVVPGVSAGGAVPASAGIPVTHRGIASSVTFVTGHEDPAKQRSDVSWGALSRGADTLCVYMGVKNLERIVSEVTAAGRPSDQAVALIRWGTTERQEVLTGTLADIAEKASAAGFEAPAIVVIGDVVSLRDRLAFPPSLGMLDRDGDSGQ